jgi:Ran-binding protein 1
MADTKDSVATEVARKEGDARDAEDAGGAVDGGDNAPATEEDFSKTFDPLVVLTEVETKTGEEEELVVFKIRSKLFRFDKDRSEWKERGTGDVRFLKHKESNKIRILMRREKTLKICLNHYVSPSVVLTENVGSDRSWVFHAVDYADGEADESLLAIRFANSENANLFRDQYNAAREHMRKLVAGEPLPENTVTTTPEPAESKGKAEGVKPSSEKSDNATASPTEKDKTAPKAVAAAKGL